MVPQDSHLTDQELLLAADGQLSTARGLHLSACWSCRARKQEFEEAIADFVRFHRGRLDPILPPGGGPRALLKARLAEMNTPQRAEKHWPQVFAWRYAAWRHAAWRHAAWRYAAGLLLVLAALAAAFRDWPPALGFRGAARNVPVSLPEPSLTPGAVVAVSREQICKSAGPKNRPVPASLQRRVFAEYGISGAEPRAYEVDYLITPALGGADDIHNLWPQSYSSAVWNARVKDALEDRLRDLVCNGSLDLSAAQHDLSSDWIAAYKKYFHTDQPLDVTP